MLLDSAIAVLAREGLKGLSHLKVDRQAELAEGTTSAYFRTRAALLEAIAGRVVELDILALRTAIEITNDTHPSGPSPLAQAVVRASTEPHLSRAKARFELTLEATRNPDLASVLAPGQQAFAALHDQLLAKMLSGTEADNPAIRRWTAFVTRTFLSGLLLRYVHGDFTLTDPDEVDQQLAAIADGIAAGTLTRNHP